MAASAKEAKREGERAGKAYAGAFDAAVRRRLENSIKSWPKIELDAKSTKADVVVAQMRQDLEALRDAGRIDVDVDAGDFFDEVARIKSVAKKLEREGVTLEVRHNAAIVRGELEALEALAETGARGLAAQGERDGQRYGGAFEEAARRRLAAASKALPPVDLNVRATDADIELSRIRNEIVRLSELDIDVDIPAGQYLDDMAALEAALEAVEANTVNVRVKTNVRAALAEIRALREFAQGEPKERGVKDGAEFGGAFGQSARNAIKAGLAALPEVELTADSSAADRAIAALRAQLAALSNLEIGVDVEAGTAVAELRQIEAQLRQLARADARIDMHTNLLATATELASIQAMVNRLDGQDVNIKINAHGAMAQMQNMASAADFSMSRLGFLIATGVSIGTMIAPAAAVAAVAISGIATAAAAATIGIGVLGLGLFGAVKAVGALDKAQKDGKKSGVSLSGAQDRVANALDGVRSAQRGLARAERERKQAVDDLSRAQEEARRQLEDMALSVKSNALAQRQARLDEAEAKRELDKVLANPRATEEEREQAKITFEQRTLQLEELGLQQQRLTKDKAEADRKGVAGSDKVLAAQERILNATESVVSAQESLSQSQRSLAAAYEKTGTAGGAALENLNDAMDALSPAGRRFAKFIFGLKDQLKGLQFAAEGGLLPGLEQGIRNLLPFLPKVEKLVGSVASTLGQGFVDFTESMKDPEWQRFFGYLSDTAVPTLKGMFEFTGNVARGIASLVVALSPFNRSMGSGLIEMSAGFARWAAELRHSQGFQQFLAYVARVGPKVVDLIKQLGIFIVRMVIAAAPVGEFVVDVFGGLFTAINKIPLPVLTVLIGLIAALATTMLISSGLIKAWTLAITIWTVAVKLAELAQRGFGTVMGQVGSSASQSTAKTNTFALALKDMQGGTSSAKSGLAGLASVLGGPWGIAILAATVLLGRFLALQAQVGEKARQTGDALSSIASTFQGGGDAAVLALTKQDKAVAETIIQLRKYGVTAQDVFRASNGEIESQRVVLDGLRRQYAGLQEAFEKEFGMAPGMARASSKRHGDMQREMESLAKVIDEVQAQYDRASRAAGVYGKTTEQIADETRRATLASNVYGQKISDLEQVYAALTSKTGDASAAAQAFTRFTEDATGAAVSANEAEEQRVRTLLDLKEALSENGTELDLSKAKTDDQRRSVLASRDALEDALRAAREKTLADIAAKVGLEEATAANEERIAAILAEIPATERNSAVVQDLVNRYGSIPAEVSTNIKTNGAEAVLKQLKDLKVAQYALEHNLTIAASRAALAGQLSQFESQVPGGARAKGGYIRGPGGPTDDQIPAWLSNGEYVIPAGIVAALGIGFFDQLIGGAPPGDGPRFARGGKVAWPFPVDVSKTKMPFTLEELQKRYVAGAGPGFLPWPSSPAAQRGDSGVWRSILAMVNAANIPYTFGNAYRQGDPLWHGSGRAIDFMGYHQDRLGQFFMNMQSRVLELIHTTGQGGYYISRGRRRTSMGSQDELHRNHLHIAMDEGGWLDPGWNPPIWNGTGQPEPVLTSQQWSDISSMARGGDGAGASYNFQFRDTTLDPGKLRAIQNREDAINRQGRAR